MSNLFHFLIAILLSASATWGRETGVKSLPEVEKIGIDTIAQFSAREHSTILFTVADRLIGYSKDGHVAWIKSNYESGAGRCQWPHPAISHDGLRVAFVASSGKSKLCCILIHDIPTGVQRKLIETADDPGEISWSCDDKELAFFDFGVSAVSVQDGTKRMLLPFPMRKMADRPLEFWLWYPMQWLHNDRDLVIELNSQVPTTEPGTYTQQANLLLIRPGEETHVIDIGSQPAVSPISDRIAYYASQGIVATSAGVTGKTILAKAPRTMLFFKEELFGRIVWSPDANRVFFGTIVSENRSDNVYLLDVRSGRREQFLSHTSIMIRGWR